LLERTIIMQNAENAENAELKTENFENCIGK
jgi:hypothetical protein